MKRLIIMTLTGGCRFPAFYVIFSLVTSVLFGPWLCHCVEISVSVVSSHHISRPGDNVTLTCRVQGVADGTTIQWLKSATGLEKQLIASDDQISDEYKLLKRYYVESFSLPSVTISILNIYDVTTEDSGRIGCVLPGVVPIHDYAMLQILKKPASISFTTNFAGMTLQENDVISARCSIGHVVPVPHVTIRIGHRSLGHPVFTNSTMNTYCQTWVMCSLPVHLDYDVQSFVTNYHVTYKDDRQLMTCSVNLTHSGWPEFSAPTSYTINVRYSPKFNCSKLMYAELSSRRYTIECHLSYNPSPYEQSVSWRHASHSHLNRLKLGESNAEIRFEETKYFPTTAEDRWSHISLVIDEVQTHHFTSYHFEATNQVGTVTHTVHLKQAQSKLPVTSASVRYVNRTKRPPIAFKAEQSSSAAHSHRPTSILVTMFMLLTTLGLNQDSLNDCFR